MHRPGTLNLPIIAYSTQILGRGGGGGGQVKNQQSACVSMPMHLGGSGGMLPQENHNPEIASGSF